MKLPMTGNNAKSLRRWSLRRFFKWSGVAVIVLPLISVLIFRGSVTLEIKRLENRARERGEPLTVKEIEATPATVSKDKNAAVAIVDLRAEHDAEWEWQDFDDAPGIGSTINDQLPWAGKEMAAAKEFQTIFGEFYRNLRGAVDLPMSKIPLQNTGEDLAFNMYLKRLKSDLSALLMLSLLAAQEDRGESALSHLDTAVKLINTLKGEQSYLGQWTRALGVTAICRSLADLVGYGQLNGPSLGHLKELLTSIQHDNGFREAMLGLRADDLATYSRSAGELGELGIWPDRFETSPFIRNTALGLMRFSGWWGLDRAQTLETFDQLLVLTNNTPEDLEKAHQLTVSAKVAAERFMPLPVFREQIRSYDRELLRYFESETSRRLAEMVVAIERYRLVSDGVLPTDLNQLKEFGLDPIPLDLFDGNPLRYIIKTNGYWVYSVHADGTDDKGSFFENSNGRDFWLRVEWPEKQN